MLPQTTDALDFPLCSLCMGKIAQIGCDAAVLAIWEPRAQQRGKRKTPRRTGAFL